MSGLSLYEEKRRIDATLEAALVIATIEGPFVLRDAFKGLDKKDNDWPLRFMRELAARGFVTVVKKGLRKDPYVYARVPEAATDPLLDPNFVAGCLWPGTYGVPGLATETGRGATAIDDGDAEPSVEAGYEDGHSSEEAPTPPADQMLEVLASFRDHLVALDQRQAQVEAAIRQLPALIAEAVGEAMEALPKPQATVLLEKQTETLDTISRAVGRFDISGLKAQVESCENRTVAMGQTFDKQCEMIGKLAKGMKLWLQRSDDMAANFEEMAKAVLSLVRRDDVVPPFFARTNLGVLSAIRDGVVDPTPAKKVAK